MSGGAWEYVMGVMLDESGVPVSGRNSLYHSKFNGILVCPSCDSDTSGVTKITNGYEWPDKRYYNAYPYSTSNRQFSRRILGDATGEMGPFGEETYTEGSIKRSRYIDSWYSDQAYYLNTDLPFFARGGGYDHGFYTGIFNFSNFYGRADDIVGFRVVLSPGGTL